LSVKDGGPAFPVIGAPGAPEDYPGMSLRDYFAAHAPKKPQPWFRPRLSGEWSQRPDVPGDLHPDSLRVVENWLDDPIWDLEDDIEDPRPNARIAPRDCQSLRIFVAAMRAHWARNDALRKEEAVERLKQWPYAWADAMLQAREAK
jgi:hypothetical protein